jgi:hypothetical protein
VSLVLLVLFVLLVLLVFRLVFFILAQLDWFSIIVATLRLFLV